MPFNGGAQFFVDDPSNPTTSIQYTVKYDGVSYTISSVPSPISSRVTQAYSWGLDSIAYAEVFFGDVTLEVRSLSGALGRRVVSTLRGFDLNDLPNRAYPGGKGLYDYRSIESPAGTQSMVLPFLPAGAAFPVCAALPTLGELDYPISSTLQQLDGSVLAVQVGHLSVIKINPDGSKEPYLKLSGFPDGSKIDNFAPAAESDGYLSCTIRSDDSRGIRKVTVLTIRDREVIAERELLGTLLYTRKLDPWEGGGRAFYMNRSFGEETIYLLDSLGGLIEETPVRNQDRTNRRTGLSGVLSYSKTIDGRSLLITAINSYVPFDIGYEVQIFKEGEVVNSYAGSFLRPGYTQYGQFLPDGRLLLRLASPTESDRDSLHFVTQPELSFVPEIRLPVPRSVFVESFSVSGSAVLFKAAKAIATQPENASVGMLAFDIEAQEVTDSVFVAVAAPYRTTFSWLLAGSVRPGLFAYPVGLNNNPRYNAVAMIGTKSSSVRERARPNLLSVTNPFTDAIYFSTPVLPKGVSLSDALGRTHALAPVTEVADGRYVTRPLQPLPAGMYVLSVDGSSRVLIHQ